METKRLVLAIILSLVAFVAYVHFFSPEPQSQKPVAQEPVKQETAKPSASPTVAAPTRAIAEKIQTVAKGKNVIIETDLVKVTINTAGGVITGWELKQFREADKSEVGLFALFKKISGSSQKQAKPQSEFGNVQLLPQGELIDKSKVVSSLQLVPFDKASSRLALVNFRANHDTIRLTSAKPSETLILSYQGPSGMVIEKRLTFHNNSYQVDLEIRTRGLDGYNLNLGTDFGFADKVSSDAAGRVGFAAQIDNKFISEKTEDIKTGLQHSGSINWFGQEDKYFTATLLYGDLGIVTITRTPAPAEMGDLLATELMVKEKLETRSYALYAGPKNFTTLQAYGRGLEQMVDYGWFAILAKPMFWLLQKFYAFTMNYGIAIILLTIVIRILLFYPSLKSAIAMEDMKKLQPLVLELKEKYKKDPRQMQQETMKLYKEHKVNPMGGCFPMLLQIPFFIALYNVLSVSIELRQAPFVSFWIKDLAAHDPYYILPVLMGLSMILMMKITTTTPDPQQAKIMMIMNIAFIFMFAWLPAGLLLYITLSNILSIVQQMYVHRLITKGERKAA
ncbi:MAG: membrane protein insertase YidC [Nitrospirota bacterium]